MTNRMIATMCLACAAIVLVMGIRMGYNSSSAFNFFYTGSKVMIFVMLAVAVFGVVKQIVDKRKGVDTSMKVFSGAYIAVSALLFAFLFYEMSFTDYLEATKLLYFVIAAAAALYLIYLIYRHEFFFIALAGVVEILYIWRFARYNQGTTAFLICQIVLLALLALAIAFFLKMNATGGTMRIGKNRYRFFPEDGAFVPTIAGLVILALIAAALFFVPGVYMMFCAYAAAAVIFGYAVYFTVLML